MALAPHMVSSTELMAAMESIWPVIAEADLSAAEALERGRTRVMVLQLLALVAVFAWAWCSQ